MTKAQFILFFKNLRCECNYSGKEKTMYVKALSETSVEDCFILCIQHYGLIPDFKIVELNEKRN